jgi:hypothetical protein
VAGFNAELPNQLHQDAKALAARANMTLKAFVIRAIDNEVKRVRVEESRGKAAGGQRVGRGS